MLYSRRTFVAVLALLCTAVCLPDTVSAWTKPWFCHEYDCPVFQSVNETQAWETRVYSGGKFVRTEAVGRSMMVAEWGSFRKLFNYIQGANEAALKIQMTVPVITRIEPNLARNRYATHFFLPYVHQKDAPQPTDSSVQLVDYDGDFKVAVRSFSGFGSDVLDQLQQLQDLLDANKVSYDPHCWFHAGYDKPTKLTHRHNEVWLRLTGSSSKAGSADAGMSTMQPLPSTDSPLAFGAAAPAAAALEERSAALLESAQKDIEQLEEIAQQRDLTKMWRDRFPY